MIYFQVQYMFLFFMIVKISASHFKKQIILTNVPYRTLTKSNIDCEKCFQRLD